MGEASGRGRARRSCRSSADLARRATDILAADTGASSGCGSARRRRRARWPATEPGLRRFPSPFVIRLLQRAREHEPGGGGAPRRARSRHSRRRGSTSHRGHDSGSMSRHQATEQSLHVRVLIKQPSTGREVRLDRVLRKRQPRRTGAPSARSGRRLMRGRTFSAAIAHRHAVEADGVPAAARHSCVSRLEGGRAGPSGRRTTPRAARRILGTTRSAAAGVEFEHGIGWTPAVSLRIRRLLLELRRPLTTRARSRLESALLVGAALLFACDVWLERLATGPRHRRDRRAGERADDSDSAATHHPPHSAAPIASTRVAGEAPASDRTMVIVPTMLDSVARSRYWSRTLKCRRSATSIRISTSRS